MHKVYVVENRPMYREIRCIESFEDPNDAIEYVSTIKKKMRNVWELVEEERHNGWTLYVTKKQVFENIHTGDILTYRWFIVSD